MGKYTDIHDNKRLHIDNAYNFLDERKDLKLTIGGDLMHFSNF